jgi:hypothetical protein
MKKIYTHLLVILFSSFISNAQVPNNSFETWTSGVPASWSVTGNITQDSPGFAGSYAAKGTVVGTTAPNLTTPTGNYFTISQPYNTFEFYYKSNFVTADQLFITVTIYNSVGNVVGSVPTTSRTISTNATTYTHVAVPITYSNPGAAAKASIAFTVHYTVGNLHAGTYFIVDNVSMSGLVGVHEITESERLQVFPNPVHDNLRIRSEADGNKPMQIKLTDMLGKTVMERLSSMPVNGFIEDAINVDTYQPGLYFLTLISDKKSLLRRIVVE